MKHLKRMALVAFMAGALGITPAHGATTAVQSDSNDPAWLQAHGLTPVANVEISDEPVDYKLPDRCWHARVFAGLKGYGGSGFAVWAYHKGIVCSLNGQIQHFHERHGKGSSGSWHDGPYPSLTAHQMFGTRHVFSWYKTDWEMGYANWGVKLALDQYWSKRVDRTVHWTHYGSS